MSSGHHGCDSAKISINKVTVKIKKNENNHYRGLHIVVIVPENGYVLWAKVFDTYKSSDEFDDSTHKIPEGYIVVAACKDDCVTKLSQYGKQWFANMGSVEIWNLEYRQGFAFVGISGRKEFYEKRATDLKDRVVITKLFNKRAVDPIDESEL